MPRGCCGSSPTTWRATSGPRSNRPRRRDLGPDSPGGDDSAAHKHAVHRLSDGFDINELMAEYRALRATVLRLWFGSARVEDGTEADQMVRFNEALDQVIAESVLRFSAEANHAKDLLLGVLGHDLRNPLNAISMSIAMIVKRPEQAAEIALRMRTSTERMRDMITDLLDFTRIRLGARLALQLRPVRLGDRLRTGGERAEGGAPLSHDHVRGPKAT